MADITEEVLNDEGIRYQFSDDLAALWEGTARNRSGTAP